MGWSLLGFSIRFAPARVFTVPYWLTASLSVARSWSSLYPPLPDLFCANLQLVVLQLSYGSVGCGSCLKRFCTLPSSSLRLSVVCKAISSSLALVSRYLASQGLQLPSVPALDLGGDSLSLPDTVCTFYFSQCVAYLFFSECFLRTIVSGSSLVSHPDPAVYRDDALTTAKSW